jgi:hypothetical protein
MNPSEQEIERMLRSAPRPPAPPDLKPQLSAQVRLSASHPQPQAATNIAVSDGWLRRWWPALAPAAVSIACVAVLAVQQVQIQKLRHAIRTLSSATASETVPEATAAHSEIATGSPVELAATELEEIARLKERVKQLTAEIQQLEQTQKENEILRAQLAAPPTLTPEEMDALAKAKEKALSIQCINNLKQFGLAVRIWAVDNHDAFPPDTLSMSNELNTPKILVCPADTNRLAASNWQGFTAANLSYEYLTPSATNAETEPQRVLSRCPIHGHIGLCDGSVQSSVARNHPDWLIERDGKLYMESNPQPANQTPTPNR